MERDNTIAILVVEDTEADFEAVERELRSGDSVRGTKEYKITWAKTLREAKESLLKKSFDSVLLDLSLPDTVGLKGVKELNALYPNLSIVVLTGLDDERVAVEALNSGAQDYLVKGQKNSIIRRTVWHSILRKEILEDLDSAKQEAVRASQVKSTFLAQMSHELRTPLTAILGFADILSDNTLAEKERESALSTVVRNTEHLLQIINEILDLSKVEAGDLTIERMPTDLTEILSPVWSLMTVKCQERRLSFSIRCENAVPEQVNIDGLRMKQILYNLVGNAIKFTHEGSIELILRYERDSELLVFLIKDTGVGIPKEKQQEIFSPFQQADDSVTRKFGGTGLGLAISLEFAKLLGGTIVVESEGGEGSVFSVSVHAPAVDTAEFVEQFTFGCDEVTTQSTFDEKSQFSGRVLLVEDCIDNQALISHHLRKAGVSFEIASNGNEAIAKTKNQSYDLVLMDMQMPELDGYSATRILRSQGFATPIVALTASAMKSAMHRCKEAGCTDYMAKPFRPHELYSLLGRFLPERDAVLTINEINCDSVVIEPELGEIVHGFVVGLPKRLAQIETAVLETNLEDVAMLAHKLAGADMFGFDLLGNYGRELEQASLNHNFEDVQKYSELLRVEIGRIVNTH